MSAVCLNTHWSLERDDSDILDADLITNNGKEMSTTAIHLDEY